MLRGNFAAAARSHLASCEAIPVYESFETAWARAEQLGRIKDRLDECLDAQANGRIEEALEQFAADLADDASARSDVYNEAKGLGVGGTARLPAVPGGARQLVFGSWRRSVAVRA
eukprot:COSAG02_NODE_1602_length_11741_cov_35.408521_7_plen_115_part_00